MKDLNLLHTFEALWRDRSVTLAAESLGLTQAAVSGSLKRLRNEYDDKLFVLVGRRMEPTPRALEMAPILLDALNIVRRTQSEPPPFDAAAVKRTFTIRTRDIGEAVCFPGIVEALALAAPSIRLRTHFQSVPETLNGLASGQVDLALGFLPSLETDIHSRPLFTQRYVCVMRAGHPLADAELTPEVFGNADHLLVEYSGSGHLVLERALLDVGAKDRIKVRMPQYLSAPYFLLDSDLLWSVPYALARTLCRNFPLVVKPHPLELPTFDVALYWHDRFHRDHANQWLRDFITAEVAKLDLTPERSAV